MSRAAQPSIAGEFVAAVRSSLRDDQIQHELLDPFDVDGLTPDVMVRPTSLDQLQLILAEAHEAGLAIIAHGGGAHMDAGNIPAGYDIALSMDGMDRIVAYEPDDLTVTVEGGVRFSDLQATLHGRGQTLPLDPPGVEVATVGGLLAANASGPLRPAHGTVRDWLIGIRVALADGTVVKSGGRVVKNVSGYDMHKLYVGSLGSLGVIAEATLKVAPSPRSESTLVLTFASPRAAATVVLAAGDAGLAVRAAELLSPTAAYALTGDHAWTAVVRLGGGDSAVTRSAREITALAASTEGVVVEGAMELWGSWRRLFAPDKLSLRASVSPSQVAEAVDVLDRRFTGAAPRISATVAAGLIRVNLTPSRETRVTALVEHARETIARYGGHVIVDAAPQAYKKEHDVFGPMRPDFAIMRRLKEEFDPKRILAPGRFVGRL